MELFARLDVEQEAAYGIAGTCAEIEAAGFDGIWTGENKHESFLPLAVAAETTSTVRLGTAVAIAFSRSPMVVAQLAWDLQRRSRGRFVLGLGTQVQAHIERRFAAEWSPPAARLRDYVGALRAVWSSFATGERLRFESESYRLSLLTENFDPGPHAWPQIEVFTSGVGAAMARSAGAYADGFHVHPFHSLTYLDEVLLPAIRAGEADTGRPAGTVSTATSVFVVRGRDDSERDAARDRIRNRIAFYGSTPSYRTVLAAHGWEDLGSQLHELARARRWDEMAALVSDDQVAAFSVEAEDGRLGDQLRQRYDGRVDQVALFEYFTPHHAGPELGLLARSS